MPGSWRTITVGTVISWAMKLILIALLPYEVYIGEYLFSVATLIAIGVSLVPSIVERNYRIHLPFELDLLITLALFLHTFMGEWLMFYEKVWLWDKILHLYGTGVISLLAFMLVYSLHYTRKLRLTIPFIGFFTVIFAVAMGAMWEILEFWVDNVFAKQMQKGLADTMWDMIYDAVAGVITATMGMLYVRYSTPEKRKRLAVTLGELFVKDGDKNPP